MSTRRRTTGHDTQPSRGLQRCRNCKRPVPGKHHADWSRLCRNCAAWRRSKGTNRPYVIDGRRERGGQRVLELARQLAVRTRVTTEAPL